MQQDEIRLNKGSDLNFVVVWGIGAEPMNLTGYSVDFIDAHRRLQDHLTLSISNAAAGEISGRIDWDDQMPPGRSMHFRVRMTSGEDTITTPQIWVNVI